MLNIRATAVCNRCKVNKSQNAPNVALRSGRTSSGPCSYLWDLSVSHLSPSLRVIPCEYVDDPYIAKNLRVNGLPSEELLKNSSLLLAASETTARKNANNPLILRVVQGHQFWYPSKARSRLPIGYN